MYSVEFSQTAEKSFLSLTKETRIRVLNVLERIKLRPFHFIKRKEGTPYFILRIGEYRTILDIEQDRQIIFVLDVGHRKNIYD